MIERVRVKGSLKRVRIEQPQLPLEGRAYVRDADYEGRRLLVAAYLYYVLDTSPMSDGEYDKLSAFVAKHWDELKPDRQWAMRDPVSTKAGGSHFRFSTLVVSAALNRYKYITGQSLEFPNELWRESKTNGRYVTCSDAMPRPIK